MSRKRVDTQLELANVANMILSSNNQNGGNEMVYKEFNTTIANLRTSTNLFYPFVVISDVGKEGMFKYDSTDITSIDDNIHLIVDNAGKRWKRTSDIVNTHLFRTTTIAGLQAYIQHSLAYFDGSVWEKKTGLVASNGNGFAGTLINVNATSYWSRIYDDEINVKWFGVKGDNTDTFFEIQTVHDFCVLNKINYHFPSGTYNLGIRSYPGKNNTFNTMMSYNGITIRGDGETTIIRSDSVDGADVFNIINSSNLTIKNLAITASLSGTTMAGSNGVSIIFGGKNITLDNIYIYDLPFIAKPTFVDGGKAITLQGSSSITNAFYDNIRVTNIHIKNCYMGINVDNYFENNIDRLQNILFNQINIENSDIGVIISYPSPIVGTTINENYTHNIILDNISVINCNKDVLLGRTFGIKGNFTTFKNLSVYPYKDPNSTQISGLTMEMVYNSEISYNGYMSSGTHKIRIGGTSSNGVISGHSTNNIITSNVTGSVTTDLVVVDFGGNEVVNSMFRLNNYIIPTRLYELQNIVVSKDFSFFKNVNLRNLKFLWSDNATSYNEILRDGTGLFFKQESTSASDATVFGAKNHLGNDVFKVGNDGRLHIIPTASAPLGSYINKIAIYDMTGALIGYVGVFN
jgi:hypothetical protein